MKTRKNLLVVFITLLLMCFFLSGCGPSGNHESSDIDDDDKQTTEETSVEEENTVHSLVFLGEFKIKGLNCKQYILYDPDNLVMYSYFSNTNDRGPEPMVNPDGTYKIYDPETWLR